MKFSAHEFCKTVQCLEAKAYSAASTIGPTAGIDTKGFREALFILDAGVAAASAEADVTICESATASDAAPTAITGAAFPQITTANDQTSYVGRIDLEAGRMRYLYVKNVGDGSNAVTLSVDVILLNYIKPPVTQVNTVAFNITA